MSIAIRNVPRVEARAAVLSLALGIALLVTKLIAYFATNSAAIFSDAMETVVNVVASSFAIYALAVAHTPADRNHPYGHGKIEFMSAGLEGMLIVVAAAVIFMRTLDTILFRQVRLDHAAFGLTMLAVSICGNGLVGFYLLRVGRRINSATLDADGRHLMADAITSVVAALALLIVIESRWVYADPLAALLVAGYMGWIGIGLLGRAAAGLMDQQDSDDERLIEGILDGHLAGGGKLPAICSYHKLRHRHSGRYHWVDFHIRVHPSMTVGQGHDIASAIEYEIEQALGEGNATAHIEPCADRACDRCQAAAAGPVATHLSA